MSKHMYSPTGTLDFRLMYFNVEYRVCNAGLLPVIDILVHKCLHRSFDRLSFSQ